jgi:uncharacterized alpha-E superfamily protein
MLSSTADHLYWMARSMERAESTARMLDITYRMSLLKHATQEPFQEWSAVLSISGLHQEFGQRYPEVNAENVVQFMALDETNPSSIISSLSSARENARAVRGTITSEVWENLNHTWLMMRDRRTAGIPADGVADFFEWVKVRSHLSRGIAYGTMLRGEPFRFMRLGTFLERADNTARILDVKYHILLPSLQDVGGAADYYQWGALLRSVSSFESYRRVYSDVITPKRVAEMLILNADMPRSLRFCLREVHRLVAEIGGPRADELIRQVGLLHAELEYGRTADIMAQGLHEYLTATLARLYAIGDEVSRTYFWPSND